MTNGIPIIKFLRSLLYLKTRKSGSQNNRRTNEIYSIVLYNIFALNLHKHYFNPLYFAGRRRLESDSVRFVFVTYTAVTSVIFRIVSATAINRCKFFCFFVQCLYVTENKFFRSVDDHLNIVYGACKA